MKNLLTYSVRRPLCHLYLESALDGTYIMIRCVLKYSQYYPFINGTKKILFVFLEPMRIFLLILKIVQSINFIYYLSGSKFR